MLRKFSVCLSLSLVVLLAGCDEPPRFVPDMAGKAAPQIELRDSAPPTAKAPA
ncbi:hypothetical protein [Lysobacter sp. CA199]|uniref:hypothetical protein n=1 Tax=Lysobacter sp. CA199 TaxID=3455608 RepID=UPI003F8D6D30